MFHPSSGSTVYLLHTPVGIESFFLVWLVYEASKNMLLYIDFVMELKALLSYVTMNTKVLCCKIAYSMNQEIARES